MSTQLVATEGWKKAWPGAAVGVVGMRGIANPGGNPALREYAAQVQAQLQARFTGMNRAQLAATPTLRAYSDYYKRFGKTYHVQLQLESVLFKGKPIVGPSAIVEAMFIAELKNTLLTAAHDLASIRGCVTIDVATGTERYTLLSGGEQALKAADMFIRDEEGILSSIVHGPDWRTRITSQTQSVVFTVYAPVGIGGGEVEAHLTDLETIVRLFSPGAAVEIREVLAAN